MATKVKVSQEEKNILDSYESGEWKSTGNIISKANEYSKIAKNTLKKEKRINIRLNEKDLELIQNIAVEEGIPYQTLISSLIHKYVSGRLLDRNQIKNL
jgi:predicted DNA binding CopG/RHH family protein